MHWAIWAPGDLASFRFSYMFRSIKNETGIYEGALMPIAIVATIGTICALSPKHDQSLWSFTNAAYSTHKELNRKHLVHGRNIENFPTIVSLDPQSL